MPNTLAHLGIQTLATRGLIRDAEEAPLEAQFEAEAVGIANALASPDGIEGATAFLEKRKPVFNT